MRRFIPARGLSRHANNPPASAVFRTGLWAKVHTFPEPEKRMSGGWGGIRTHDTLARMAVFKTAAFSRSATHPALSPPNPITPSARGRARNDQRGAQRSERGRSDQRGESTITIWRF